MAKYILTLVLVVSSLFACADAVAEGYGIALPPSLLCSACEVTAREIYNGYIGRSKNERFAGTELELIEVLDEACDRIVGKYAVAQEVFGAHLKVFADPTIKFDAQNVEPADYYSFAEEEMYTSVTILTRLRSKCQEYIGVFEDNIHDMVTERTGEGDLRMWMCNNYTEVCTDATLKPYKQQQSKRRRKWKAMNKKKRGTMAEKLADEMEDLVEKTEAEDEIEEEKERVQRQRKKRKITDAW